MNYKSSVNYHDAMEWLLENYEEFPCRVLSSDACKQISNRMFRNWRWVESLEGEVVFGNGIEPGIDRNDFNLWKKMELI